MSILRTENLSFSIGQKKILDKISFHLKEGCYLGIIGPNGAGKSTLLKLLFQFLPQTEGSVFIDSQNIKNWSVQKTAEVFSYAPQTMDWNSVSGLTVQEFLEIGNPSLPDMENHEIIKMLNIGSFLHRFIETLSGGEQQKVLLAGTFLQNTKIILLDEAMASLDIKHQIELENIIQWLRKKGKIIISVFHSVNYILKDRKLLGLRDGCLVFFGSSHDYVKQNISQVLFDVKFQWTESEQYYLGSPEL